MNSKNEIYQFSSQIRLNLVEGNKALQELKKSAKRKHKDMDSMYDNTDRSRSDFYFPEVAGQPLFELMY